jgi:outer membrane immunogenic protein
MLAPNKLSVHRCHTFAAALAVAGAAFTAPVVAADLPVKASPDPVVVPSWTGFYFGVHGGWGWGNTHISDPLYNPTFDPVEATYSGPLAGGQLGVNWQHGNIVFGAELDGSWTFVRGNTNRNQSIITSSTNNDIDFRALVTGTGRIGYAMGSWLAYAKGGVAWADLEMTTQYLVQPTTYHQSPFGAVAGAGMEVAFTRNVSAVLEYNLFYFPTEHLVFVNQNTTSSLDHVIQMVKAGINVRFGGDPILPR